MAKATAKGGTLNYLDECYIKIPGAGDIYLNNLPDISDSKSAAYNDEPIMGRSFPLKTYSHSENRSISMTIHLFVVKQEDVETNLWYMKALESCVYPRTGDAGVPFKPPPVCRLRCGRLLGEKEVCAVLKQYTVKFPTEVPWDEKSYLPYKLDIDCSWEVVYRSADLPGQERIMMEGR